MPGLGVDGGDHPVLGDPPGDPDTPSWPSCRSWPTTSSSGVGRGVVDWRQRGSRSPNSTGLRVPRRDSFGRDRPHHVQLGGPSGRPYGCQYADHGGHGQEDSQLEPWDGQHFQSFGGHGTLQRNPEDHP